MFDNITARIRARVRRFLGVDVLQDQTDQIKALQAQLERLERIVYALEESHYHSIGDPRPRRDNIFVGGADDFQAMGEHFLDRFKRLCGLQPHERILDVGCGIGRIALPLTKYLDVQGTYEGFDIVPEGIEWCNANITPRYPNFHFQLANVFNQLYNPGGRFQPKEYQFPYADATFDFVFLTSVFTHMLPDDMEHYLNEIARVLRAGGRCLITFFLWNAEVAQLIENGKSHFVFGFDCGSYRLKDAASPESAVCYDQPYVLNLFEKYKLSTDLAIYYGEWCGRPNYESGQDMIVAWKGNSTAN